MVTQQFFYKYKSLSNIENFLDIVVNKRIYVSKYTELNDPMEGLYQFTPPNDRIQMRELMRKVKGTKSDFRILSLTKSCEDSLMWSHYGDGHKGVCIKMQVKDTSVSPIDVIYDNTIPDLADTSVDNVKRILSHKFPFWSYENEVRFLKPMTSQSTPYLNIKISDIYFGTRAKNERVNLLRNIISSIDNSIKCHKLSLKDLKPISMCNYIEDM